MIQTLSCASTDTPIVMPITQWFGNGFGHIGSTSNMGAWTPAACTAAFLSRTIDPTPSPATSTRIAAPIQTLRFILVLHFPARHAFDAPPQMPKRDLTTEMSLGASRAVYPICFSVTLHFCLSVGTR